MMVSRFLPSLILCRSLALHPPSGASIKNKFDIEAVDSGVGR